LDATDRGEKVGCEDLLDVIQNRVRPQLHVFGHIHEAYGQQQVGETLFVNASMVDLAYCPVHEAIVINY
jgi:Icc-related predicted phosphoesterase